MAKQSMEYCAFHYLNQYLRNDERHIRVLADKALTRKKRCEELKDAATFYKVARNLRTRYKVKKVSTRYGRVLDLLDKIDESKKPSRPEQTILRFSTKLKHYYQNYDLLSFSSKMLWLKYQNPIIIYDKQARKALQTAVGDLKDFYSKWRLCYSEQRSSIKDACDELPAIASFAWRTNDEVISSSQIRNLARNEWFRERVLDMSLWFEGD